MKPKSNPFLRSASLAASIVLCLGQSATAGNLYWDSNGTTAGAGTTPTGTWGTDSFWSTDALGLSTTGAYVSNSDVFFSAGTDAGIFKVTQVSASTQNVNSLTFEEGNTTIRGGSSSKTNLTGEGGNITVNTGATATIGDGTTHTVSGTVGLTKIGGGTLTLNYYSAGSFTGGVNVNGGTLALSFANWNGASSSATTLIGNNNALAFNGGAMTIMGRSTLTAVQNFTGTTVSAGGGSLLVNPNGGTSMSVALGGITATAAGGSFAVGKTVAAGSGALTITTTTDKDATGTYGGRIVWANGTADTGFDWATTASGSSPYTLSAYSAYSAAATSGTDTNNSRITATTTLAGALTTNSLKIEAPAASQTLELGENLLTLTNGGLLSTGTNAFEIKGTAAATRLTAGNSSGSYDLIVHQYNSGGLTIGAVIGNNESNAVNLVKAGTGTLTLSGVNTYTGQTSINAGTLKLASGSSIGSSSGISLSNGATLDVTGLSASGVLVLASGQNVTTTTGSTGTITGGSGGGLTLNGNNTVSSTGGGTLSISRLNVGNTNGTTNAMTGGNVRVGVSGTSRGLVIGNGGVGTFTLSGGTLTSLGGTGSFGDLISNGSTGTFIINGGNYVNSGNLDTNIAGTGATATLTLTSGSATIGTMRLNANNTAGRTTIVNLDGGIFQLSALNSGASGGSGGATASLNFNGGTLKYGLSTLALTSFTTVNVKNGGAIIDTNGLNVSISNALEASGTGGLTKTGSGTLTLSGANTYTGNTLISNGKIAMGNVSALQYSAYDTTGSNGSTVGLDVTSGLSSGSLTLGGLAGSVDLASAITAGYTGSVSNLILNPQTGSSATYSSAIADGASGMTLTKNGAGMQTLSGTNIYTGTTTVNNGTLLTTKAAALPGYGTLAQVIVNGGTLGVQVNNGAFTTGWATTDVDTLLSNATKTSGALGIDTTNASLTQWTPFTTTNFGSSLGLTKLGTGTLTLDQANTYTGTTTIIAGTIRATTSASALGAGTLSLAGGNLELADNTGLNFARNTTVANTSTITSDRTSGGGSVTQTLGTLSIGAQTLNVAKGSFVTSGTAGLTFGGTTLTGAAVFDTATGTNLTPGALTGNYNFTKQGAGTMTLTAASTRSSGVTTLSAGTLSLAASAGSTAQTALGTTATTLQLNGGILDLSLNGGTVTSYPTTVGGNVSVNLNKYNASAAVTNTLGTLSMGAYTLTTTKGANNNSGTPGLTFGTTTLTAGPAVFDVGTGTQLTLGNVSGSGFGLTKQSSGSMTVGNYTAGTVIVNGGTFTSTAGSDNFNPSTKSIVINNGGKFNGLGNGIQNAVIATINNGGTFDLVNNSDAIGGITGAGTLTNSGGTLTTLFLDMPSSQTFDGSITGNINLSLRGLETTLGTAQSLTLTNTGNSFAGNVAIGASSSSKGDMSLVLGDSGVITDTAVVTVNGSTTASSTGSYIGILDMNGKNETIAGLAGGAPTGTGARYGSVTNKGAVDSALTLNVTGTQSFGGVISDGATNKLSLVKSGLGTQTLSGASGYTGGTTVNDGILNVTGSTHADSAVAVGGALATGTPKLAGSGTINGAVTVKSAGAGVVGRLDAGDAGSSNPAGKLTVNNNLTFETGSIFEWDIKDGSTMTENAGDRGVQYDAVDITGGGALSVTDSVFRVIMNVGEFDTGTFWDTDRTWASSSIFNVGGTLAGFTALQWYEGSTLKGQSSDLAGRLTDGYFSISGTTLTWTAVPELSNVLIGGLLGVGLLRRRRKF